MLTRRMISSALLCLALAGCQGRGLQPTSQSATRPTTNPTPATTTSAPEVAPEQPSTTATTEPIPDTTPETVPVTRPRATTRTTLAYVAPEGGTGACGGSLPPCWVMMRESRGDIRAVNVGGCGGRGCYGKWQFDPITSRGLGYSLTMDQYDEPVQDDAARTLYAGGAGCRHWNAC